MLAVQVFRIKWERGILGVKFVDIRSVKHLINA